MDKRRLNFYGDKEFNREAEGEKEIRNYVRCEAFAIQVGELIEAHTDKVDQAEHIETHPYEPEVNATITKMQIHGQEATFMNVHEPNEVDVFPDPIYAN